MYSKYICGLICVMLTLSVGAQTAFDSLKRNSNLDTSFQPSKRATIYTDNAELRISGFLQPALYLDNNNVFSNDLFVTSQIPTTQVTDEKFRRFHLSANQSRLGFSFVFPKAGNNTTAFLEADFFSSKQEGNANFRLRHAYITFKNFTIGQTWTNFGDVNNSPNTLDLEGPNSMPATRVAQIRWQRDINQRMQLILAVEEPKNDYTALDSAESVRAAIPEIVVKPVYKFANGTWVSSLVYKPIIYTDKDYSFKKKLGSWGFSSSVTFRLAEKAMLNPFGLKKRTINVFGIIGEGTQGSVNDFGGLGYEAFPKDNTTLETMLYYGGYVSYSFVWKKRWSTTSVASYLHQQQPQGIEQIFEQSIYMAGNCVYAINKYFTVGCELLYGIKKDYDGSQGSAVRLLGLMRLIF